ncbi:NAD-dependent succinate-semialdehyde dehydrogenase [Rhodococcus ruber]|uniref:Succinate-semialdehyde dehydrogenase I, NADP-dependent n=1 Tax=Rhodococcus ruber TaxID=1830 RepID=A0A098BHS2_9NOCA|nr:NAD-dependent succinate-semialdehyde dehydrogenase [Rhodococcus ruber]MCD2129065.1 NAD-dependent succinate-semialdehyde dehydrogenase [Rhodococcus ruber]MCZ4504737.1 NAD-dependent succinate-semialdehyde dehydrogenase [Rhodococcus ruber]MCZ4532292.1 NAD-dependent succinate-semialdehyde dehydrogenase [Rhodococcus ruber]MCZ4622861.1 NAD-dependent succinate-semialdehyde dehydrogenase [Rhodococcus ruber]MDI9969072.1 NAD-dependent succinate-semialdehyde dehydrogenase [Rhodococcus ruber]
MTHTLPAGVPTRLWLGGKLTDSSTGATFPVEDPATGAVLADVADASADDGLRALDLAVAAQAEWAATPPRVRGEILRTAFELVHARADDFARVITLEMGKTVAEARGEVNYGAEFLRWFAEEAVRIGGRTATAPAGNGRILVTKEPVGPVLAITPWNFPLAMATRKIGPALAAGCPILVKPAAETPLTMLLLGQVFADAGLPAGVLSILPATDAAALTGPLLADARLRKITFTGSTGVGKLLVRQSADRLLRTSMELGGNAPFLVFDDADLDAAVDGAMAAKMRNGGEACTAANRFHVARRVAVEFTDKLTARIAALRTGHGLDDGTDLGPLITARQRATVDALVRDAVERGARVRTGGQIPDGPGTFYPPTVLDEVPADARLLREEIFGPVAAITVFDTEDEAVAAANDTEYGLAAYFYTRDLDRAMRVAGALKTGMVGVNRGVISDVAAPFGGVKESGFGREGAAEGIEEYLDTKYIAL